MILGTSYSHTNKLFFPNLVTQFHNPVIYRENKLSEIKHHWFKVEKARFVSKLILFTRMYRAALYYVISENFIPSQLNLPPVYPMRQTLTNKAKEN